MRMLGQRLEHVECDTRHVKIDADVLIVETTVQSAMSCETILVGDATDLLVVLCFHDCQRRFLRSLLQTRHQVRNKEEPIMLEHQVCAKSAETCSVQQSVVCSCHLRQ